MAQIKIWFLETRPQFLVLSLVLSFLGTSVAWHDGYFHLGSTALASVGLLLAHTSVRALNDYFDYVSGIDLNTKRTPFSAGSHSLDSCHPRPMHKNTMPDYWQHEMFGIHY